MKIAKIELFKVPPRWLFLKMTTDDGLVGWGDRFAKEKQTPLLRLFGSWASS